MKFLMHDCFHICPIISAKIKSIMIFMWCFSTDCDTYSFSIYPHAFPPILTKTKQNFKPTIEVYFSLIIFQYVKPSEQIIW